MYTQEMAEEIIMTVGQAFEVAYQAVIKARSHYSPPVAKVHLYYTCYVCVCV